MVKSRNRQNNAMLLLSGEPISTTKYVKRSNMPAEPAQSDSFPQET